MTWYSKDLKINNQSIKFELTVLACDLVILFSLGMFFPLNNFIKILMATGVGATMYSCDSMLCKNTDKYFEDTFFWFVRIVLFGFFIASYDVLFSVMNSVKVYYVQIIFVLLMYGIMYGIYFFSKNIRKYFSIFVVIYLICVVLLIEHGVAFFINRS